MRLAVIGGVAGVAILGGGLTAVASVSTSAVPGAGVAAVPTTTSTVTPTARVAPTTGAGATSGAPARPVPPANKPHLKPHLDGTVTSVSGTTVLIKDRAGFTRTIAVSSKTTYEDGLKAALPAGTKIHAEGAVDTNGTSLDATTVGAAKASLHGGPEGAGPGMAGPGGPRGGHRDGDDRPAPTGAPSTSSAAQTTS